MGIWIARNSAKPIFHINSVAKVPMAAFVAKGLSQARPPLARQGGNRWRRRNVDAGPITRKTTGLRYSRYDHRLMPDRAWYSATVRVSKSPVPLLLRLPDVAWCLACDFRQLS